MAHFQNQRVKPMVPPGGLVGNEQHPSYFVVNKRIPGLWFIMLVFWVGCKAKLWFFWREVSCINWISPWCLDGDAVYIHGNCDIYIYLYITKQKTMNMNRLLDFVFQCEYKLWKHGKKTEISCGLFAWLMFFFVFWCRFCGSSRTQMELWRLKQRREPCETTCYGYTWYIWYK